MKTRAAVKNRAKEIQTNTEIVEGKLNASPSLPETDTPYIIKVMKVNYWGFH